MSFSISPADLDAIPDPGAHSFVLGEGIARRDIVVVKREGRLFAYENACPHQHMPLETFPGRFFDAEGKLLVCSTHGARFRPEDGVCVSGPCVGKALRRVTIDAGERP